MYSVKAFQLKEVFDKNLKLVRRWYSLGVMTRTKRKSHALRILRIWTNRPYFKATLRKEG